MPGLEDLYREIILDHYRSPRNRGELEPPAHRAEGFNPLCGDEIIVYVDVTGDAVTDIAIGGQGCSISQASASMMSAAVKGKSLAEARDLVRAFKALMSIHENELGADDDGTDAQPGADPLGFDETLQPGSSLGDLEALRGVVKFPVRIKCATLSWNTFTQALDEAASE